MAQNVLAQPTLWFDAISSPTSVWNGTAYVLESESDNIRLQNYTTVSGDFIGIGASATGIVPIGTIQVLVNESPISDIHGNTIFTVTGSSVQYDVWQLPAGETNVDFFVSATASSTTTLTIVPEVQPQPVANNGSLTIAANSGPHVTPTSFTESGSPITPTSVAIVSGPSHGTAIVSGISIDYTPDVDFNGADSFTYNGVYGGLTSNTATINIFVDPVPTPPSVLLRWSDDGGHNWSNEIIASAGEIGETSQRVIFRRLGSTRRNTGLDRIFEISGDDYNQVALVGASINDG